MRTTRLKKDQVGTLMSAQTITALRASYSDEAAMKRWMESWPAV